MKPIQNIKQQLRRYIGLPLQSIAHYTGMMQLSARLNQNDGAIVLMYHSVAEISQTKWIDPRDHVSVDIFEKQVAFLAKRKKVVDLAELVAMLRQGKTPENGTIVITFDDGYLDNLTVAASILDHYGLKATLFLPTGYIDRGETQWVDQVYSLFKFRTTHELTWSEDVKEVFDLMDSSQHAAAYRTVCYSLLSSTPEMRCAYLEELNKQLHPFVHPPRLTMTWDDVKMLLANHQCFQIGGHTLEHTDMTSISEGDARKELKGCMQRIEEMTGVRPRYFSFPYGRTSRRLRQLVAKAGFRSAFGGSGSDPIVNSATDPYALPRVEAPASMRRFGLLTNTANTGIWRRLGR